GFTVEARTVEGYTSFYLLADHQVQGYVKTIRSSKNFAEVYIELKPPIRGQGLAPKLLRHAMLQVHRQRQRLFYAVAADNAPSMATARRAGLRQAFSLCRFIS
ncbi:MAG: GNAT family N-acetyltransferase, partial [Candidatus Riflebacteria bacterium]|nr:GNAT family N-acetyltransferase [Candidatus Riflebacteria bacterium]